MGKIEKMLDEYQDQFEENFPMMLCRTKDEEEIISIIEKCIEDDEIYEPELDKEAYY